MIKYFIENNRGEWLTDPEQAGASWTRDPYKAWAFEYKGIHDMALIIDPWSITTRGPSKAIRVYSMLMDEECVEGPGYSITEHECQEERGKYKEWKHQITGSQKHLYPETASHYLSYHIP